MLMSKVSHGSFELQERTDEKSFTVKPQVFSLSNDFFFLSKSKILIWAL